MKPVTVRTFQDRKQERTPITMLTCYDVTFARLLDAAGIDAILVGDSLGMVVKGEPNTLAVTVDETAYHIRAVARGVERAHIVGDMPFMSYQASEEDALKNAARLLQAGAHAVKLEGGAHMAATVRRLVQAGIPVMGHVGLTPQSVNAMGGFVVQGRDEASRRQILDDAKAIAAAGAYALVLEGVPSELAAEVTASLSIPTIGIGAGNVCDGQVLVLTDLLGLDPSFKPKFVKRYLDGAALVGQAISSYIREVQTRAFPDAATSFAARPQKVVAVVGGADRGYGPTEPGSDPAQGEEDPHAGGNGPLRLA